MPNVPMVPGARVVRALQKAGFDVVRITGSHHIFKHPDGRVVSVPVHAARDVKPGTLRGILADAELSVEEFRELL
jgi:predicted RNA binding protein YcfA (HicA-like mRNA interferase family)